MRRCGVYSGWHIAPSFSTALHTDTKQHRAIIPCKPRSIDIHLHKCEAHTIFWSILDLILFHRIRLTFCPSGQQIEVELATCWPLHKHRDASNKSTQAWHKRVCELINTTLRKRCVTLSWGQDKLRWWMYMLSVLKIRHWRRLEGRGNTLLKKIKATL